MFEKQLLETLTDFDKLIAPWVIGCDVQKKIIALQSFANFANNEKIHLLCIGPPSCGKSEIMLDLTNILPRVGWVQKGNFTAVGLRDELERSDLGTLALDEFDKIEKHFKDNLLSTMESGLTKIVRHNERWEIPTRSQILAFGNPKWGMWNMHMAFNKQVRIDPVALSRFFVLPFFAPDTNMWGDMAVRNNTKPTYESKKMMRRSILIKGALIDIKRKYPIVTLDEHTAREIARYAEGLPISAERYMGRLKIWEGRRPVIHFRMVNLLMSMCKARARMSLKDTAGGVEWSYVKGLVDTVYGINFLD